MEQQDLNNKLEIENKKNLNYLSKNMVQIVDENRLPNLNKRVSKAYLEEIHSARSFKSLKDSESKKN